MPRFVCRPVTVGGAAALAAAALAVAALAGPAQSRVAGKLGR